MARKRKKATRAQPKGGQKLDPRTFKPMREEWTEYALSDGVTLRLRPILIEIVRVKDKFAPDGNPLYNFKALLVTDTKAPKRLRRKP